jgi:uncharacterized protein
MNDPGDRIALVTGASAGLGAEFARQLAQRGCDLVLTARRRDRLEEIADELREAHGVTVTVLPADLSRPQAPGEIAAELTDAGIEIDVLINNAGYGMPGYYMETGWQEHADFIQVMVVAVAQLTHALLPGMVERGYGRVISVSSLAGLVPAPPGHTLYSPAKAFLIKMSEALASEMEGNGVHVTVTCPGFTYTEFHDVVGNREQVGQLGSHMWMQAEDVVRGALDAAERGQVLHVPGAWNKGVASVVKILPHTLGHRTSASQGKKMRKQHR